MVALVVDGIGRRQVCLPLQSSSDPLIYNPIQGHKIEMNEAIFVMHTQW